MNRNEMKLYRELNSNVDSFDRAFEGDSADTPLVTPNVTGRVGGAKDVPTFAAQFDVSILPLYFDVTVATGAHAQITPAALPANLQTKLFALMFGNSDFASGFKFAASKYPTVDWVFTRSYIYGESQPDVIGDPGNPVVAFPTSISSLLQKGDLVLEFYYDGGGATDQKGVIVHRCQQVGYGTLLDSISSDRFVLNNIRYTIPDATKVAQYGNQISLLRQSLFGKNSEDFVSPQSFKSPDQFQTTVIDIPIKKGIDKETLMGTFVNYDVGQMDWSIFVWKTKKVQAIS